MNISDAGAKCAYAITRGVHKALSVVGHTDEGAWFGALLRKCSFCTPFGGICQIPNVHYMGMPAPSVELFSTFVELVDSIALGTAALVADCDPLVKVDDLFFPTVVAVGKKSHGNSVASDDGDDKELAGKIGYVFG